MSIFQSLRFGILACQFLCQSVYYSDTRPYSDLQNSVRRRSAHSLRVWHEQTFHSPLPSWEVLSGTELNHPITTSLQPHRRLHNLILRRNLDNLIPHLWISDLKFYSQSWVLTNVMIIWSCTDLQVQKSTQPSSPLTPCQRFARFLLSGTWEEVLQVLQVRLFQRLTLFVLLSVYSGKFEDSCN